MDFKAPSNGFVPGSAANTTATSKVELSIQCRNLADKDLLSKSDPMCVLFSKEFAKSQWHEVDRTEVIQNTLNPDFVKKFVIDYFFEERQCLKFQIYDSDSASANLSRHDFLGEMECTLGEIVSSTRLQRALKGDATVGKGAILTVTAEELPACKEEVTLHFSARKLDKKDFFGKSDPFLAFYKVNEDNSFTLVHRTEVVKNTLDPTWVPFTIPVRTLCAGDHHSTQLACTIAIDFTASNGNPSQPQSLHYVNPQQPNHYENALTAVGQIIEDYDSDKLFPVLGFGAKLPPDGRVSHEFFVNFHPTSPFCNRIGGVVDAYQRCIRSVQLYGPTNFAPVINHVAKFAAHCRNGSEYYVLLILTDGVITDMPQTRDAIVAASGLPMSIIIVGIGPAEFDAMEELDGDKVRLTNRRGVSAQRDIVQFVPFRDFVRGHTLSDMQVAQARLAKEVLAEIPDQFLSYMKANRISPGSWRVPGDPVPQQQQQPAQSQQIQYHQQQPQQQLQYHQEQPQQQMQYHQQQSQQQTQYHQQQSQQQTQYHQQQSQQQIQYHQQHLPSAPPMFTRPAPAAPQDQAPIAPESPPPYPGM